METLPPKYVSPSATWRTKFILRLLSIAFLIVVAGVGGSLASNGRLALWTVVLLMLVPALVVTFAWNVAEATAILKRPGHRGIHPGAIVAIDLFAWLGWIIVVFFLGFTGILSRPRYWIEDYSGYDSGYRYDGSNVTKEDRKLEDEIMSKGRALITCACFVVVIHFILFVFGCYETNVRNRMPRTVYVMQPVYGPQQVVIPGGYQQLGAQGQPLPPMPPNQAFMMTPPNQLPVQPPATHATETKGGPARYA